MRKPKFLYFLFTGSLCLLISLFTQAQADPTGCTDIGRITMIQELRQVIQTAFIDNTDNPENVYPSLQFKPGTIHKGAVPDQYVVKKALVKFNVCNSSDTAASVYFFPGFYYKNIRLFRQVDNSLSPLPDILPEIRERSGYRFISVPPHDTMTIVAELSFLKTYVNKIRPRLINQQYLAVFVNSLHSTEGEADLVTYIFCGLLLMMVLYSLSVFLQGGNKEFLYYSVYAFLLGLMLFTKAYFGYHTHATSYFFEEYFDFILQCLGIIFYMLFMQRFLGTNKFYRPLHNLYNAGILLLSFAIVAYTFLHYATNNYPIENLLENVVKGLLLLMIIAFLIYSLKHWNDKLLRFLFWGNLVYLLFAFMSLALILAPQVFNFRGLSRNALMYYEVGLFFELVFFLVGLNYKNRRRIIEQTREREALKAQTILQEYEKEIAVYKAQQEERERISADMHDELGSGMTAIRLMSEIARNKMKENTPVEIEKISRSADDVLNKMNAIIWSMNSSNDTLDNLVSYIRSWSLEYFESTPVLCKVNTPEQIPTKELTGEKRRNIFLCVKESLNNVLKHANATEVLIDIHVNHELVIRISDNGKGIDLDNLRQFGNGLKNITRRMESIEGTFTIVRKDSPGENKSGTVTTLRLPV